MSKESKEFLEKLLAFESTKDINNVLDDKIVSVLDEMRRVDSDANNIGRLKKAVIMLKPRPSDIFFI